MLPSVLNKLRPLLCFIIGEVLKSNLRFMLGEELFNRLLDIFIPVTFISDSIFIDYNPIILPNKNNFVTLNVTQISKR